MPLLGLLRLQPRSRSACTHLPVAMEALLALELEVTPLWVRINNYSIINLNQVTSFKTNSGTHQTEVRTSDGNQHYVEGEYRQLFEDIAND